MGKLEIQGVEPEQAHKLSKSGSSPKASLMTPLMFKNSWLIRW